jgi:hypothetical protein
MRMVSTDRRTSVRSGEDANAERHHRSGDPASPFRLAVYGTCAGTVAIVLGQGVGSTFFAQYPVVKVAALTIVASLVAIGAGVICDPILSYWDQIRNHLLQNHSHDD